jgi:hypothetical protein
MADICIYPGLGVYMSLRVRWRREDGGHIIRCGFAPIEGYHGRTADDPFEWIHHCGRDDGPADLDQLARDAMTLKLQRRGWLVA